ncbi:hypothetical protein [Photobacterium sp. GSS17]|nr:hypothetical protein [Photobacterium sp. GSS17]
MTKIKEKIDTRQPTLRIHVGVRLQIGVRIKIEEKVKGQGQSTGNVL